MRFSLISAFTRYPRTAGLIACSLGVPALTTGMVVDDYYLAARLRHASGAIRWRGLLDAFVFVPEGGLPAMRELGEMPWWSDPTLKLALLRPLSALTHALDFAFWPHAAWWMHVESLLLLAALHLAVAAWYARLLAGRDGGLALALFALAPGHVFAAGWLANRNAVLAALFAVLCLLAHDLARRGGRRRDAVFAALALLASLLAGELGVTTFALLVAYALCLDRGRGRLRSLVPALLIVGAWLCVHRALGYGTRASSLYADPLTSPLAYLTSLVENLPWLTFAQFGLPGTGLHLLLSRPAAWTARALLVALLSLWAPRVIALVKTDPRARFCALAALLALFPVASTAMHERLLILADVPAMALLALAIEQRPLRFYVPARLTVSALLALLYAASLTQHSGLAEFDDTLRAPRVRSVVYVNPPSAYYPLYLRWVRTFRGGFVPARVRVLASGIYPLELTRMDMHTLRVRCEGGLLQPLGRYRAQPAPPAFSPVYLAQVLNQFPREEWRYRAGDVMTLDDLRIRVVEATADGFPATVDFRFEVPLEDPSLLFLRWEGEAHRPYALPEPGRQERLPAILQ